MAQQETGSRSGAAAGLVVAVNDFMRFAKVTVVVVLVLVLLLQAFIYANAPLGRRFSLCISVSLKVCQSRENSLVANYTESLPALTFEHQSVALVAERLH